MGRDYLIDVKCPYCLEDNKIAVSASNSLGHKSSRVRCFNAEKQVGCMKEMVINIKTEMSAWTEATPEELAKEKEKLIRNIESPSLEDRMGGG